MKDVRCRRSSGFLRGDRSSDTRANSAALCAIKSEPAVLASSGSGEAQENLREAARARTVVSLLSNSATMVEQINEATFVCERKGEMREIQA